MEKNQFSPAVSQTFSQFLSTLKVTSSEWANFFKENPLSQQILTRTKHLGEQMRVRYPNTYQTGQSFIAKRGKTVRKIFANSASPSKKHRKSEEKKESDTTTHM